MSTEQLEKVLENPASKEQKSIEQKPNIKESQKSKKQTRKEQKEKRKQEKQSSIKPRRRVFPIWLRLILVVIFASIALVVGLMVGYGILGGGDPIEALKVETWQHLIDIVLKPA